MNKDTKSDVGKIVSVYGDYVSSGMEPRKARLLVELSESIRSADSETQKRILRELRTRHPQPANTSVKPLTNELDELWPENLKIFPGFYNDFAAAGWKPCDVEILAICLKMVLAGDDKARALWLESNLPTKWIG